MDNKFIIIVPVYNAAEYINGCLDSIISQEYNNYEICVIDDCSTDGTWEKILDIQNKCGARMNICRNEYRIESSLVNIMKMIELFALNSNDIIVEVDGDDQLYDNGVLSYLNGVYQDKNTYMTYGTFIPLSGTYGPYGYYIPNTRTYRKERLWYASHLRTFKKSLWSLIRHEDMRDGSGNYYGRAWDAAIMYPMIEMCGHKHLKFIERIMYIYNDINPLNDMKTDKTLQIAIGEEIQDKPCYNEL